MRLIQFIDHNLGPCVGVVLEDSVLNVTELSPSLSSVVVAFREARRAGVRLAQSLETLITQQPRSTLLDYSALLASGLILPPITEEVGTRLLVTGTGLTHLGSAQQRDAMHVTASTTTAAAPQPAKSDSKKMFEMGLAGGRPEPGQRGAAPEWFFKGDARILRGYGQPLDIPPFALDGGEEPEVVGVYIVDDEGIPCRLGFAQGNEWSDHVTENINYLYLAPSKLRTCSIGPELVTNFPFDDARVTCRVLRGESEIYHSGELRTGERNMCHSLANLEDHHFKFPQHRLPGDIHFHFVGTSKLSFPGRTWRYGTDDVVEVAVEGLGRPLRNPIRRLEPSEAPVAVAVG